MGIQRKVSRPQPQSASRLPASLDPPLTFACACLDYSGRRPLSAARPVFTDKLLNSPFQSSRFTRLTSKIPTMTPFPWPAIGLQRTIQPPHSPRACPQGGSRVFAVIISMWLVSLVPFESREQDLPHGWIVIADIAKPNEGRHRPIPAEIRLTRRPTFVTPRSGLLRLKAGGRSGNSLQKWLARGWRPSQLAPPVTVLIRAWKAARRSVRPWRSCRRPLPWPTPFYGPRCGASR